MEAQTMFVVRIVPETGAVGSLAVAVGLGSIGASLVLGSRPVVALLLSAATASWILLLLFRRERRSPKDERKIPPLPPGCRLEPPLRTAARVTYWTLAAVAILVPGLLLSVFLDGAWLAAFVGGALVACGAMVLFRCWQAWRWERRWALLSYRDAPFWRGGCLFFYGERAPQP